MRDRKIVELAAPIGTERHHSLGDDLPLPQRLFVLAAALRQKESSIDLEKPCALIEEAAEALLRHES